MADLQFSQINSWTGGIDDTNLKPGGQYFSVGMDVHRRPNYLTVSDSLARSISEATAVTFTETIYWFEEVDGDLFALDTGGDIWKKDAGTGWVVDATWPHADAQAGAGQGLIEYDDELFWAANTTVGRVTTPGGAPGFTDNWQSGLTSSSYHPMEKFVKKLFIGHGPNIASWDGVSWDATALELPLGFECKSMAVIGDYLAIGTVAPAGDDARIFFWDGTSSTYNREVIVQAVAVDALHTWSNILWVIAGKAANLHYYDGANLKEVAKLADVHVESGESVTVRPSGLHEFNGGIMIAINNVGTIHDRVMPGIWRYEPDVGALYLPYLLHTGVTNAAGHAYSLYSNGVTLFVGGSDSNTGATDANFVDESGGSRYTESAYWTSQWIEGNVFANKHFRKYYLNFREFPATGATNEITVKYRLDDTTRRLNNDTEYTATGGGAAYVDIAATTGLLVGDEVTVTGGPSSGDIRRIITLTATRITVDRNFTATPVNAETKFVVERWTEMNTVNVTDDANATDKDFWLTDLVGKKIQFKMELRDAETTGEEVAISEATLNYIQKRPT